MVSGGHRKGKLESGILLKCMRRACTETYTLYKLIICGKVHICGPESLVIYFCIQVSMFPYFRFSPTNDDMVYSASSDGKVGYTDLETGTSSTLLNLNPNGWQVQTPSPLFFDFFPLLHHSADMKHHRFIGPNYLEHAVRFGYKLG